MNKKKKYFKDIKCFNCNKYGHYASDCKAPKKNKHNKKINLNLKKDDEENFLFQTYENEIRRNTWLLDSGATNHISCLKENFCELKAYDSKVKVGDGRNLSVI